MVRLFQRGKGSVQELILNTIYSLLLLAGEERAVRV
jgi:hypothetical protein